MLPVGVMLPVMTDVGEYLADVTALEAAGAYAVWVEDSGPDPWVLLGALAAITHRMVLGCVITAPEEWPATRFDQVTHTLQTLSRGRFVIGLPPEGWVAIPLPADRDAWNAAVAGCEAAGATGVIVPWTDRLIDLLRNPEPDDRSDLLMSTG